MNHDDREDASKQRAAPPHRHAVEVVPDAASLASRAAEWLIEQIAHAVQRRGRAVIALSGGTTPRAVFALLAAPPWRERIAWDAVHFFWGDERFVAKDDVASNVRMTYTALLDHVDVPAAHIYEIPSDDQASAGKAANDDIEATFERAQSAACLYATTLHAFYGGARLIEARPLFDVVLLGLGEDGHTASLFPGTPALDERHAWAVAVKTDNATAPVRITLTYPTLESTRAALVLATGAAKHAVLKRVLDGDESLPAARLRPHGGTLWIVDQAAAA
jgi:6-phosphogluconolactonase